MTVRNLKYFLASFEMFFFFGTFPFEALEGLQKVVVNIGFLSFLAHKPLSDYWTIVQSVGGS
jgi:hypothetical protein